VKLKLSIYSIPVLALLFFCSCSSAPKVSRLDAAEQTDLSGNWNDSDVRLVCDSLLSQAFDAPRVDSFIKEFKGKNGGALPTVIVGRFRNNSDEHINTQLIAGIMRTAIIADGKLDFVEGGEAREDIRGERNEQQLNSSETSASRLGYEQAANLMLTGEVNTIVDKADNKQTRTYFVKATLTNVETNRILWEGEYNEIKKLIVRAKNKF
jgi:PBP1b-binding outer membrane lipoprotein LpoB